MKKLTENGMIWNIKAKSLLCLVFSIMSYVSVACWYQKSNYTDYIATVNDQSMINITEANGAATYIITNNKVVDFPLTVSMKLISNVVVDLNGMSKTSTVGELLRGKLQYRVLPGGNWVTVQEYSTPTGTIPKESAPATYFGTNNIWPQGCKAGDVIMIRLYVTDGMWESGDLSDKCQEKLIQVSTPFGQRLSLPNSFSYIMDGLDMHKYNIGGEWYPHLAMTVVYSGKERPLR